MVVEQGPTPCPLFIQAGQPPAAAPMGFTLDLWMKLVFLSSPSEMDVHASWALVDMPQLPTGSNVAWSFEGNGIRYVTPAQRHAGQDREVLRARHQVYSQVRQKSPRRWSGATRNWSHIATVTLNPERTEVVTAAVVRGNSRPLAA